MHGIQPVTKSTPLTHSEASFPAFDYLRIIAALGVFLSHADSQGILPENFGNACVQVFFALSGFLIGSILLRIEGHELPRFYFNRALRIWVPYGIAVCFVVFVTIVKQPLGDFKLWEFLFYDVTFTYNWFGPPQLAEFVHRMPLDGTSNHFWSICVEEQFYLFAPVAFVFMRKFMVVALLFAIGTVWAHFFASIALGVIWAMTWSNIGNHRALQFFVFPAAILTGLSALWIYPSLYDYIFPFIAVSIVGVVTVKGKRTRVGTILAGATFSFYLNAWLSAFAVNFIFKHFVIEAPQSKATATLLLAIAASITHFKFIESPILAARRCFFTRTRGTVCMSTAAGLIAAGLLVGVCFRQFAAFRY